MSFQEEYHGLYELERMLWQKRVQESLAGSCLAGEDTDKPAGLLEEGGAAASK